MFRVFAIRLEIMLAKFHDNRIIIVWKISENMQRNCDRFNVIFIIVIFLMSASVVSSNCNGYECG